MRPAQKSKRLKRYDQRVKTTSRSDIRSPPSPLSLRLKPGKASHRQRSVTSSPDDSRTMGVLDNTTISTDGDYRVRQADTHTTHQSTPTRRRRDDESRQSPSSTSYIDEEEDATRSSSALQEGARRRVMPQQRKPSRSSQSHLNRSNTNRSPPKPQRGRAQATEQRDDESHTLSQATATQDSTINTGHPSTTTSPTSSTSESFRERSRSTRQSRRGKRSPQRTRSPHRDDDDEDSIQDTFTRGSTTLQSATSRFGGESGDVDTDMDSRQQRRERRRRSRERLRRDHPGEDYSSTRSHTEGHRSRSRRRRDKESSPQKRSERGRVLRGAESRDDPSAQSSLSRTGSGSRSGSSTAECDNSTKRTRTFDRTDPKQVTFNRNDPNDCILSVEPASVGEESDVQKSKSYIINEPRGEVVDKFVEGDESRQHSQQQVLKAQSSAGSGTMEGSQISILKRKERLACNFSVEPLSPMSELSDANSRYPNAPGFMTVLEQYLPEDVSNGPINVVFDQYIPSFTGSSVEESTQDGTSSSSTSHPLRFVNELVMAPSDVDAGKRSSVRNDRSAANSKRSKSPKTTPKKSSAKQSKPKGSPKKQSRVNANQDLESIGSLKRSSQILSDEEVTSEVSAPSLPNLVASESDLKSSHDLQQFDENASPANLSDTEEFGRSLEDPYALRRANSRMLTLQQSYSIRKSKSEFRGGDEDGDGSNRTEGFEITEADSLTSEQASGEYQMTDEEVLEDLRKLSRATTAIQINSPKWRGWKPEELEVILLESPQSFNIQTLPTAATETSSSGSFAQDLQTLQIEMAERKRSNNAETPLSSADRSGVSSSFSIPGIAATLSYDSEDPMIPRPPTNTMGENYFNIESDCDASSQGLPEDDRWAQPTQALTIKANAPIFNFSTPPSSQTRTPKTSTRRQASKQSIFLLPFRTKSDIGCGDQLLIRSVRSDEFPLLRQTKTYFDTIVEQFNESPRNDLYPGQDDKENNPSTGSDWQSSLDSLRQIQVKASPNSQRLLLSRLIGERNGAIATMLAVQSKLSRSSKTFQDALSIKDQELEGLRRANQILRVHVAHVRATKIEPDKDFEEHRHMKHLTRRLQDLNDNGAVVERRLLEKEAKAKKGSRLYRSERTRSSEFVEIDKCIFELRVAEVTTLQVSDTKNALEMDSTNASINPDHQIQIAISKIVAKETAFLQQRVESLELELQEERSKPLSNTHTANNSEKQKQENSSSGPVKQSSKNGEDASKSANNESEQQRIEELSRKLEEAEATANKLKNELHESRSSCDDYRDRLYRVENELTCSRKANKKAIVHLEKSLKYYKNKARNMEKDQVLLPSDAATGAQLSGYRSEIASLRELVDTLQTDYAEAERQRVETSAKSEAMETELKRTKRDLQSRILDNKHLLMKTEDKSGSQEIDPQFQSENKKKETRECETSSKSDDLLEHYKRSVTKLEEEISSIRETEKSSSDATRLELSSLRELVENVRQDYVGAKHDRDRVNERCRDMAARNEKLKEELQNTKLKNQEVSFELEQLKEAKEACERKISSLETERAQLQLRTDSEFLQSHGNVEVFKLRIQNLENEIKTLEDKHAKKAEESGKHVRGLEEKVSDLESKLDVIREERNTSTTNLENALNELSQLKSDLHKSDQDKTALSSELCKLQAAKEDYDKRLSALKAELDTALKDKQRYLDDKNKCIERCKSQMIMLDGALQDLKKREASSAGETRELLSSREAEIKRLTKDLSQSTKALEKSREDIKSKEDRITLLQMELEQAQDDVKKASLSKDEQVSDLARELQMVQRDVAFKEKRIAKLRADLDREAEDARKTSAAKEERISSLRRQLFNLENERDTKSLKCDSMSVELERAKRDLESRILDNAELSLRVEQLFAAKEECEEKIATIEASSTMPVSTTSPPRGHTNDDVVVLMQQIAALKSEIEQLRYPVKLQKEITISRAIPEQDDKEEELLLAKMRISTLEGELEELRELTKSHNDDHDVVSQCSRITDDMYSLNREKQEALAKYAFMAQENEKIKTMLEITRDDLSQSIIEISRLEMDLEEASNAAGVLTRKNHPVEKDRDSSRSDPSIKFLSEQNDALSKKLEAALTENSTLQSTMKQNDMLSKKLEVAVAEKNILRDRLKEIEKLQVQHTSVSKEIDVMKKTLEGANMENTSLRKQLKDLERQHAQEKTKAEEMQEKEKAMTDSLLSKYKVERQGLLRKIESLEQLSEAKVKAISQLEHDKRELQKKVETLEESTAMKYNEGRQDMLKIVESTEHLLEGKDKTISQLECDKEDLQKQLDALKGSVGSLEQISEGKTKTLTKLELTISQLEYDKEDLQKQVDALKDSVGSLEQISEGKTKTISKLEQSNQELEKQVRVLKESIGSLEQLSEGKEKIISQLRSEKQERQEKMTAFTASIGSLEHLAEGKEKTISQLQIEKQELQGKVKELEESAHEKARDGKASEDSEKRALLDEIRRLEKVQDTSDSRIAQQQASLQAALDEISSLKGSLVRKGALDGETSRLRARLSGMESKLYATENMYKKELEKCRSQETRIASLSVELRELESKAATAEKEAAHFKIQISEMEQKMCTAEDSFDEAMKKFKAEQQEKERLASKLERVEAELSLKQEDTNAISRELATLKEKVKALSMERLDEKKKSSDSRNMKKLTTALAIAQENESELIRAMNAAQERDRGELLLLREQVASLQNEILACEEQRSKLSKENQSLASKFQEASTELREKEQEIERLVKSSEKDRRQEEGRAEALAQPVEDLEAENSSVEVSLVTRDDVSSRMAETLSSLEINKSRMNELEEHLKQSLRVQQSYVETIDFLKKELVELQAAKQMAVENRSANKKGGQEEDESIDDTLAMLQKNKARMMNLEQHIHTNMQKQTKDVEKLDTLKKDLTTLKAGGGKCADIGVESRIATLASNLEKVASEKDTCLQEIHNLKQELSKLKHKAVEEPSLPRGNPIGTHVSCPTAGDSAGSVLTDHHSENESHSAFDLHVPSDMTVDSRLAMSISSAEAIQDIVQKHTLYAQNLNQQLGQAKEREEEVSRTVERKVSLLQKQIAKMKRGVSLEEQSALSGSALTSDPDVLELDLECRLADVAQLSTILELIVADKTKSEQKIKALFQTNRDYLKEVKSIIAEKDSVLKRQGSVLETLIDELGVLKAREKVEARTLISEITLLEENVAYLQRQYDREAVIHQQAENRLEIALREQQSLEVGLKQVRAEREHCQRLMPKVTQFLADVKRKMEARISKLRNSDCCTNEMDHQLFQSVDRLKKAVDDFLSYTNAPKRKHLRVQTIKSSSSDTGEAEYFITLNDYDYQLYKESAESRRKDTRREVKAKAASQQRFVC